MPLSFAQQRLWFLSQMEGVSEAYHVPYGVRICGKLDRFALRGALDRIVARHEALRTTFALVNGEPEQRIAPVTEAGFALLEQEAAGEELEAIIAAEAREPFDLEKGPLIRGRLVRESEEQHVLLLTMHHIVSDGWSMGVLLRELSALYRALREGEADGLPEMGVQYADYAVWQREWMQGEVLQRQGEYWKKTLAGVPELLEVPGDHTRPAEVDYAGSFVPVVLDEELSGKLKGLGRRQGATLFMTLLSGWAALLGRLSGQSDVAIGTPVANRGRGEIENLIGFFVNTLVMRVDLSGMPTVAELVKQVRRQALEGQQNQDIRSSRWWS